MRGYPTKKQDRLAEILRLRDEGLYYREIAAQLDLPISTIHQWVTDPDGAKSRKRRRRYAGTCVDCGSPTDGSNGAVKAPERCGPCHLKWFWEQNRIWDREHVIVAIKAWASEHNGAPPRANDWNPALARQIGHPERAEKFERDNAWPHVTTVMQYFGGWNRAIAAAGFEPRPRGHYGRPAELVPTERIVDLYRSGMSSIAVAAEVGMSPQGVLSLLKQAGEPRRPAGFQRVAA